MLSFEFATLSGDGILAWGHSIAGELALFAAGYVFIFGLLRAGVLAKLLPGLLGDPNAKAAALRRRALVKELHVAASVGDHGAVRATWDREKARGPLPLAALQEVLSSLLVLAPDTAASELATNLALYPAKHSQVATRALAEALAKAGRGDLGGDLEALVAGREPGRSPKVKSKDTSPGGRGSPAAAAAAAQRFFQTQDAEAAAEQILERRLRQVPANILNGLFRLACDQGDDAAKCVFSKLQGRVPVPADSYSLLLHHCLAHEDVHFARQLDRAAFLEHPKPHYSIYEPLLKLYAKAGEPRALELFAALRSGGHFASEGLCGCLLARSGEGKNLALAECIVEYCRERSMMTLAIFKTLMKAYASCGRYDLACDLHDQVLAAGLEPDHVMYSCLVKFAVKCGRRELSEQMFIKSKGGGDMQNFMWLIRAAGREGDVSRAEALMREAEGIVSSNADLPLRNCMLDVYVTNGRTEEAHSFFEKVRQAGHANIVTYNTMMKMYCAQGQHRLARQLLHDMANDGIAADSASYNCLLGGLVESDRLDTVWDVLDEMTTKKVPLDNYSVAIMMKVAKKARSPPLAERALAVLDALPGPGLFEDEVLYNTVLDACIQRRNTRRLAAVMDAFSQCSLRPSVPTVGLMIKANSLLKQTRKCWALWRDMVEVRGLVPNGITLSCMLDALISARQVDDAVALFRTWQSRVPPNIVMYGTLIKGFATLGDAERAMEMYREIHDAGLKMNLLAYTSLIDASGRAGRLKQAESLLVEMREAGIAPNIITYSALVKGYTVQGDLESAFELFSRMSAEGVRADTVLFNTLLDGCVKHSRFQLADHLLTEMDKHLVESSPFTLSIIIKLWGKRRDLQRAFDAVRASASSGLHFDVQVATSLISACFLNQSPDRAVTVLDEMSTWRGCQADAVVYGALLSGLVRFNALVQALTVAQRAVAASVARDIYGDVWSSLLAALKRRGMNEEWVSLMSKLKNAGVNTSACEDASGRGETQAPRSQWRGLARGA